MTAIGYLKTDIRKIIKQEIVGFYGIILLLSLPPLLVITSLFAAGGDVAWSFVLQLHGLYIGFLLVAAVVMYRILYETDFPSGSDGSIYGGIGEQNMNNYIGS